MYIRIEKNKGWNNKTQVSTVMEQKNCISCSLLLDSRESTIVKVIITILATSKDSAPTCTVLDIWKSNHQTQSQSNSRFTRAWLTE